MNIYLIFLQYFNLIITYYMHLVNYEEKQKNSPQITFFILIIKLLISALFPIKENSFKNHWIN